MQKIFKSFLVIFFLFSITAPSYANPVQYIYDDLGRLSRVVDENGGYAAYEYDAVGNLISISNGTALAVSPVLQSINPDVFFIETSTLKTSVVITGQNLFTTQDITADNPALILKTLSVTDTSANIEITVPSDALPGVVHITVKTVYGSATIGITLYKLTFSPSQLVLTPGTSEIITATISPATGMDMTIPISNDNPAVASTPQSVTIPSIGTTNFNITALAEGVAILSSFSSIIVNAAIYVTQPFTPEPGESITSNAKLVSVSILPSKTVDMTPVSLPISVYIQPSTAVDVTPVTPPVSVYIEQSSIVDVTTVSQP